MTRLAADGSGFDPELPPLKPLPFLEAIAWAKKQGVVLPEVYYGQLQGLARASAFTVSGLAGLDQIESVRTSLIQALENGETLRDWQQQVADGGIGLDLPPGRMETIFRNNIQGSYARGRCEQQRENLDTSPWMMYDAVNDSRTRPAHAAMDGLVARFDDPIWKTWTPPSGHRCRCRRIALSSAQADRFRAVDLKRLSADPELAAARASARPDPGWDYSVCEEPTEGLRRAIAARLQRCAPERLALGESRPCQEQMVSLLRDMADYAGEPAPPLAPRVPWPEDFPSVAIHAAESRVKKHPAYTAAKAGNAAASLTLVGEVADDRLVMALSVYRDRDPLILPVHGLEGVSLNTIPLALGVSVAKRLGYDLDTSIVQTTKAGHTGAVGWWRLRSPALFGGTVESGRSYILIDDFIGMGGTYANLRGYIETKGGIVLCAQSLTGQPRSAVLTLQLKTLEALRGKHGTLEPWWQAEFGYGFDALTESEALYLLRTEDANTIRRRLAAAAIKGEG
ncbi:MAG: hypothetical protein RIR00_562 [Pseudomonadota bacterium]